MMADHICPPDHRHGVDAACYGSHRCRCVDCREGHRLRMSRRRKNIAYGRHKGVIPAATVHEHVNGLRAAGWYTWQIGEACGVSEHIVFRVSVHEDARLREVSAERLLTVQVDDPRPTQRPGARQDATGSRRRLQALAVVGYALADVARHIGMRPSYIGRLLVAPHVCESTRVRIAQAYDDLWDKPRVGGDAQERFLIRRTKARAAALGWVGPLAWDDDTIDDPAAVSEVDPPIGDDRLDETVVELALSGDRPRMSVLERDEVVTILTARAWSAPRIGEWVGCSSKTVDRTRARLHLPVPDQQTIREAA